MHKQDGIVVTGAAGFIGSYLTGFLNSLGYENIYLVDDFYIDSKKENLSGKKFTEKIQREDFFDWHLENSKKINSVFHLGARTDTTEMDYEVHKKWNLDYSKRIWELCTDYNLPLIYASSAATYGAGELGYKDSHDVVKLLNPLNPYGLTKNEFDIWALSRSYKPPFWAGLKFFNVYGPNEYHKGRMASVVYHAFNQIQQNGSVKLFRSHNRGFKDGEQLRDFIYVKDVVNVCCWLMEHQPENGLYNLGTGKSRTFIALVTAIFNEIHLPVNIQYIDTPLDIRDRYQYFTEADMGKLIDTGYHQAFYSLEEGVGDYVREYLLKNKHY